MSERQNHKSHAEMAVAGASEDVAASDMTFAWSSPEELRAAVPHWEDLAENAASPNPFYSPGFVLAHLDCIGWAENVQCATVWNTTGDERRLDALAILQRDDLRWGWPIRTWRSWTNSYFIKFQPLLRFQTAGVAARALYAGLSENGRHRTLLLNRAEAWSQERPSPHLGPAHIIHPSQRAALMARDDVDGYMKTEVSKKFRANSERNMRRLSDLGDLTFKTVSTAPEVRAAVDDLMRLELAGWKGKQGTSLASCSKDKAFGLAALQAGQCPQIACDVLSLAGTAVAVSINLISGGWLFGFKTAFDETLKKQSPGSVLHLLGTRAILENRAIIGADSTCVPGHPLESVWRDRISCATTIRSIGAPISASRLKYVVQTETVRNSAKSTVKTIYYSATNKKVTTTKA
ncbi:MAG: GNAT family N-acetyltransferase [Alphaproteobacteria bacterium]|nr:GNAT family N-acetyltransferase [Alphaproteobacteria bacterium]